LRSHQPQSSTTDKSLQEATSVPGPASPSTPAVTNTGPVQPPAASTVTGAPDIDAGTGRDRDRPHRATRTAVVPKSAAKTAGQSTVPPSQQSGVASAQGSGADAARARSSATHSRGDEDAVADSNGETGVDQAARDAAYERSLVFGAHVLNIT
jgi:hypothetical protein